MRATTLECVDKSDNTTFALAGLQLFFCNEESSTWCAVVRHAPYFFLGLVSPDCFEMVQEALGRKLEKLKASITLELRVDLTDASHLLGGGEVNRKSFLKLTFPTVHLLQQGRDEIRSICTPWPFA
eukprot:GHVT01008395.1.p1 GENE.GHVT01008395.1~~GHVT01008395.1.p1  ORF type:complete len:126 (-),score=28.76 GHVT01008395.1:1325-1702(-)